MKIWVCSQVSRFSSEPPILIFESPMQSGGSSSLILEPPPSGVISSHFAKIPNRRPPFSPFSLYQPTSPSCLLLRDLHHLWLSVSDILLCLCAVNFSTYKVCLVIAIMIILLHRDRVVWVRNQRVNVVIICLVRWEFKWRSFLPPEEIAKSSLLEKVEYEWVAPEVGTQYSLFIWSCLLHSWLGCVPLFEKDASLDIVSLERVNTVECVCHDQRRAE